MARPKIPNSIIKRRTTITIFDKDMKIIIDDRPEYIQVTQGSYGYIVLDGITWGLIEDDGLATTDRQVIDVMEAGSMFGWDIPLVNNYKKSKY